MDSTHIDALAAKVAPQVRDKLAAAPVPPVPSGASRGFGGLLTTLLSNPALIEQVVRETLAILQATGVLPGTPAASPAPQVSGSGNPPKP